VVRVADSKRFTVARVETRVIPNELRVNGLVVPDDTRTVHVTSVPGGTLVDLRAHLGDEVQRGQVLLVTRTPGLTEAIIDYRKALADQAVADTALQRMRELSDRQSLDPRDLQRGKHDAETAAADVHTAGEHIRILGGDLRQLSPLIAVRAPITGTVVQQTTAGLGAAESLDDSPNLLTIADLSRVWVLCDMSENNLADVQVGDPAEVDLHAYPDRPFAGTVIDISRVLDRTTRTAKVRVALDNRAGLLRLGMLATARFAVRATTRTVAPAAAVLRLDDRSWVFREEAPSRFRRSEVQAGRVLRDGTQEILGGLSPGDSVVADARVLANGAREGAPAR
jgi:cobalt-zinc-cadmium efflux system membrane fusion protein